MSLFRTKPIYPEASKEELASLSPSAKKHYRLLNSTQQQSVRRGLTVPLQRKTDTFVAFCGGVIASGLGLLLGREQLDITDTSRTAAGISSVAILGIVGYITQNMQRDTINRIPQNEFMQTPGVDLKTVGMRPFSREAYIADRLAAGSEIPAGIPGPIDMQKVGQYLQAQNGVDFRIADSEMIKRVIAFPVNRVAGIDIRIA